MAFDLYRLMRPLLFLLPPETVHEMALRVLEAGWHPYAPPPADPALAVRVAGLGFPNPLGLAAGLDKDGRVADAFLRLGCGFAEVGTVTPLPQPGNPPPRIFRLPRDRALINRLGFNSAGAAAVLARLEARPPGGIVGVNIGANRDSPDRMEDYVRGIRTFARAACYFTLNVSSPNTPGLRALEAPAALGALLSRVLAARDAAATGGVPRRPVFVKLSPDIREEDIAPTAAELRRHEIGGIVISNTTAVRPEGLRGRHAHETGGLSGLPLFGRATALLARFYEAAGGTIPLIGVGGIGSGEAALAKIEAGASLVQIHTGLIYEGPGLLADILRHLSAAVRRAGVPSIAHLTGTRSREWASKPLT